MKKIVCIVIYMLALCLIISGCGDLVSEEESARSEVSQAEEKISSAPKDVKNELSKLENEAGGDVYKFEKDPKEVFEALGNEEKELIDEIEKRTAAIKDQAENAITSMYEDTPADEASKDLMNACATNEYAFTLAKETDNIYYSFISDAEDDVVYATVTAKTENERTKITNLLFMASPDSAALSSILENTLQAIPFSIKDEDVREVMNSFSNKKNSLRVNDITIHFEHGLKPVIKITG